MMDKYNIGEKKLKSIIKNVTFVNDTHSKIWANINTELDLVLNKIKALNEVIQPPNLVYISKDTLKARLDIIDKEFKEKMDKTDANIELLNKHIQEELYPPEWWESALSGAEGFTVSLIRNTTFQPLSELARGLDKDASNNAIKNMDGTESWLREHTYDENAYLWGSKAGEITAGVIGIYEMIQGGILVFAGLAGEVGGTLLTATGIGLPVGAFVTTTSGGLVVAGGASFTMGIATAGSSFERAGKPIEDTKADLSDLQEVDSTSEPVNEEKSGFDIENIRSELKTEPDTAFFWFGRTDGVGGANVAADIAKAKDGVTLESTIDSKKIEMPEWEFSNPTAMDAWDLASAAYAEQVSGEIRAVVGSELSPGNI